MNVDLGLVNGHSRSFHILHFVMTIVQYTSTCFSLRRMQYVFFTKLTMVSIFSYMFYAHAYLFYIKFAF